MVAWFTQKLGGFGNLLEQIENGGTISCWQEAGGRFKELATGILLQFADSQMAGAAGFADQRVVLFDQR
mgnify:CR=1 FL=1